eukprot:g7412.t1
MLIAGKSTFTPCSIRPGQIDFPNVVCKPDRARFIKSSFHSNESKSRYLCAVSQGSEIDAPGNLTAPVESDYRSRNPDQISVLVVGSTGYIGKFVVRELTRRGYNVIAFARAQSGIGGQSTKQQTENDFEGADVRFGDVTDLDSLRQVAFKDSVDVVISCLASRTGGKKDSWLIDYESTKNCLEIAKENGSSHFILLSAICVQKPLLEFQRAKLKFESELMKTEGMTYSIIRPTSYFKSLAGQVESIRKGAPYVMFGNGELTACKPISEQDLAAYIVDAVLDEDKMNKVLPIGGPGAALTPIQQSEMIFKYLKKPPKHISVPVGIMDGVINFLSFLERFFPNLEDSVEFGRIGKYYATESMLVWDPVKEEYRPDLTPGYGEDTLDEFFKKAINEGMEGQELGDQAVFGVGK